MKKWKRHVFNVRYLDDIYGVMVMSVDDSHYCWQIKYRTGLIYKHEIQKTIEKKMNKCRQFREAFLEGWVLKIDIDRKCKKCESHQYMIGG